MDVTSPLTGRNGDAALAWQSAVLALAACLCLALPADAAPPAAWPYDPALCAQDAKGKRYIAVGLAVLGIQAAQSFMRSATELTPAKRLTPPNPADEPGCPDNPQQVSIRLGTPAFVMPNFDEVQDALGLRGRQFGFGPMYGHGRDALGSHPPIQDLPSAFRAGSLAADLLCQRPDASIAEENGVKTCRWPPGVPEPATAYIVDPHRYGTPAGDLFRVDCGVGAAVDGMSPCDVGPYATPLGFTIGYSFLPGISVRDPDLIDRVISYDRQIREALAKAVIPDYPWQDLSNTHPVEK